jgi:DNA-binding NtrC family response regulator
MSAVRILVVDDNRSSADALVRALRKRGDDADATYDGASAIERIESTPPDLVLTDLRMEPVDGMEVLRAARAHRPPIEVIVFTAYGAVETAVEAMHLGARDFLTKPVTLEQLLRRLDEMDPKAQAASPVTKQSLDDTFEASSPAAQELLSLLRRAADVPSPVWLEGEIGAGREHAAYALHRLRDAEAPFVVIDVSRDTPWPETGTVVLPNIDSLPTDLQRHLVRRLQHVPQGVRIVATASADARQRVSEGALDPELYYKLAVIVVQVPPLREREEDILPLLKLALQHFAARYKRPAPTVTSEHEERVLAHAWPGNIRELLNVAERAVVLGEDALRLELVRRSTPGLPTLEPGFSLAAHMERIEKRILAEALRKADGDRAVAGRLLGVERNTLRYKLQKYKLIDR